MYMIVAARFRRGLEQEKKRLRVICSPGRCDMLAQHPDTDWGHGVGSRSLYRQAVKQPRPPSTNPLQVRSQPSWPHDGVQGGLPIFRRTFNFFRKYGYRIQEVKLRVSFGKGRDNFWTNVFPSPLVHEFFLRRNQKLGNELKRVKRLMQVLDILPIKTTPRSFRFRTDFSNKVVLPMMALFLETGNQTPHVSSVLLDRLFNDRNAKLWDYDPATVLPNLPTTVHQSKPGRVL